MHMTKEKYAVLDTDFISKTHLIRKDDQNKLIDRIMEMPDYQFYCHEQIKSELKKHNLDNPSEWLETKISEGTIHCTSDEDIIDELQVIYSDSAEAIYAGMLKNGCEAYKKSYFEENFIKLQALDYGKISKDSFISVLKTDCDSIGEGKNLGELKSYVLIQTLNTKLGEQVYVFCSDDKNARNGIASLGGVRCLSVLSAFLLLYQKGILSRDKAKPYIHTYLDECKKHNQTVFKVYDKSNNMKICRIPCEQILDEIYMDKLEILKNGNLKYKQ